MCFHILALISIWNCRCSLEIGTWRRVDLQTVADQLANSKRKHNPFAVEWHRINKSNNSSAQQSIGRTLSFWQCRTFAQKSPKIVQNFTCKYYYITLLVDCPSVSVQINHFPIQFKYLSLPTLGQQGYVTNLIRISLVVLSFPAYPCCLLSQQSNRKFLFRC